MQIVLEAEIVSVGYDGIWWRRSMIVWVAMLSVGELQGGCLVGAARWWLLLALGSSNGGASGGQRASALLQPEGAPSEAGGWRLAVGGQAAAPTPGETERAPRPAR